MNLLGKGNDPKFWSEDVATKPCYKKYLDQRLSLWEQFCENKPILALKYSEFKMFHESGNRTVYEGSYFKRRKQLGTSAILSLVYPEEPKYITYLNDIIYAICDEYTWCVPAHNTELAKNNNSHLDLFATETGFALAQIDSLLGDRLEPLIRDRIRVEVNRRVFTSFTSDTRFFWEHGCTSNWAAVCGASVAGAMMLLRPDLFEAVKPRIDKIMENYLSGFNDDGYCLEGTHYWHYGFGFFTTYADMVKTFTNGECDYFKREKIKNIATFIQKMFLSGKSAVSFADGAITCEYHIGLVHYLKKLYPDDVKVYSPDLAYFDDGCCRFPLLIRAATWLDEDVYNNPESDSGAAEYYADEAQWYVKRTSTYGFAAKAGHNGEHHNHNDVGTFIFSRDNKQLITDMGKGKYSKQYFRPETRYDFIECSSLGHSVPFFGADGAQKQGAVFTAKDVSLENGVFSMDIAGAYGIEELKSLHREFSASDDALTLSDSFDYSGSEDITERLISFTEPELCDGYIKIDSCKVYYDASACTVSTKSTTTSVGYCIYIIDFKLNENVKEFKLTVV